MFRRIRVKYAAKFGKLEHAFGRYMCLPYLATLGLALYRKDYTYAYIAGAGILFWLIYLSSHTFEKKLYGHYGPRG